MPARCSEAGVFACTFQTQQQSSSSGWCKLCYLLFLTHTHVGHPKQLHVCNTPPLLLLLRGVRQHHTLSWRRPPTQVSDDKASTRHSPGWQEAAPYDVWSSTGQAVALDAAQHQGQLSFRGQHPPRFHTLQHAALARSHTDRLPRPTAAALSPPALVAAAAASCLPACPPTTTHLQQHTCTPNTTHISTHIGITIQVSSAVHELVGGVVEHSSDEEVDLPESQRMMCQLYAITCCHTRASSFHLCSLCWC